MIPFFLDEIRQDVEDAVYRMKPWKSETGATLFSGWARMAQPIEGFNVVEVTLIACEQCVRYVTPVLSPLPL